MSQRSQKKARILFYHSKINKVSKEPSVLCTRIILTSFWRNLTFSSKTQTKFTSHSPRTVKLLVRNTVTRRDTQMSQGSNSKSSRVYHKDLTTEKWVLLVAWIPAASKNIQKIMCLPRKMSFWSRPCAKNCSKSVPTSCSMISTWIEGQ